MYSTHWSVFPSYVRCSLATRFFFKFENSVWRNANIYCIRFSSCQIITCNLTYAPIPLFREKRGLYDRVLVSSGGSRITQTGDRQLDILINFSLKTAWKCKEKIDGEGGAHPWYTEVVIFTSPPNGDNWTYGDTRNIWFKEMRKIMKMK